MSEYPELKYGKIAFIRGDKVYVKETGRRGTIKFIDYSPRGVNDPMEVNYLVEFGVGYPQAFKYDQLDLVQSEAQVTHVKKKSSKR